MDTKKSEFIRREQRFSLGDLDGIRVGVRRTDGDNTNEFSASLIDFSRHGIKLSIPENVQFEEKLLVRIEMDQPSMAYVGEACVRHMRADEDGLNWQVGCRVEPPLPNSIVEFLAVNSGVERRSTPRIAVNVDAILLRQGGAEESVATLVNYSEGGFCIWSQTECRVGEPVRLSVMNPHGDSQEVSGRIQWINSDTTSDGFRMGCTYGETDSYEKLLTCVPVPLYKRIAIEDRVKWYVIVAALLGLFIPPVVSMFWNSDAELPQAQNSVVLPAQNQPPMSLFPEEQHTSGSNLLKMTPKSNSTFRRSAPIANAKPGPTTPNFEKVIVDPNKNDIELATPIDWIGMKTEPKPENTIVDNEPIDPSNNPFETVETAVPTKESHEAAAPSESPFKVVERDRTQPLPLEPYESDAPSIDPVESKKPLVTTKPRTETTNRAKNLNKVAEPKVDSIQFDEPMVESTPITSSKTGDEFITTRSEKSESNSRSHFRRIQKSYKSNSAFNRTESKRKTTATNQPDWDQQPNSDKEVLNSKDSQPTSVSKRKSFENWTVRSFGKPLPPASRTFTAPNRTSGEKSSRRTKKK